ncbi:MarR family winged helix-turn-helix transcriptional regulator [Jiella sp. M17.18]|uniref:MarR family winged helix-turn-helix transcriptional regulator n=1 Tax=Jiella sp. M17.18 TaxID=3234247 RepID=UPI0034DEE842
MLLEVRESHAAGDGDLAVVPVLLSIAKSTRALNMVFLSEIGLSPGQDRLLDALDPIQPLSSVIVAAETDVKPSTVSKMTDRLERDGYVVRVASNLDSRLTLLALTPAGVRMQKQIRKVWRRMEEELAKGMPQGEFSEFAKGLVHACDLLRRQMKQPR